MARRRALLDADVLYPAGLRDLLLRLADRYLFTPLWSADIPAEWTRSLLADRLDLAAAVLTRTRAVMDGHFPEAVVTGYAALADDLDLPDPGDRHVLAAAIRGWHRTRWWRSIRMHSWRACWRATWKQCWQRCVDTVRHCAVRHDRRSSIWPRSTALVCSERCRCFGPTRTPSDRLGSGRSGAGAQSGHSGSLTLPEEYRATVTDLPEKP